MSNSFCIMVCEWKNNLPNRDMILVIERLDDA